MSPAQSITPPPVFAVTVAPLTSAQWRHLATSGAWRRGSCPVSRTDLRYVKVTFWGFDRRAHTGELMMNKDAVEPLTTVMRALFVARFPIRSMTLIDAYGGSDDRSMHADNAYVFGCGRVPGNPDAWSQHAYGRAIDLNPIENPEIRSGVVSPPEGAAYVDRRRSAVGMIHDGDAVVRAFTSVGWVWGGSWRTLKDYMHFSATGY
ncbi:MAG: M15 family metallopeptidase [Actinomycetota bacterium]